MPKSTIVRSLLLDSERPASEIARIARAYRSRASERGLQDQQANEKARRPTLPGEGRRIDPESGGIQAGIENIASGPDPKGTDRQSICPGFAIGPY
jgi:hypothetical protein